MDSAALLHSWASATSQPTAFARFLHSHLFAQHPELRSQFPAVMAVEQARSLSDLEAIIAQVDRPGAVASFMRQFGPEHRLFQVHATDPDPVASSVLAGLEQFLGDGWTPKLRADWQAAFATIRSAIPPDGDLSRQLWQAQVTGIDRRTPQIVIVRLRPEASYDFVPGQSLALEVQQAPQMWRHYSPAGAPRSTGELELHVSVVPGGVVSQTMARSLKVGDRLRLGPPVGRRLVLPRNSVRDLVMIAGGTGLAPLLSALDLLDRRWRADGRVPAVHLFHGARDRRGLYEDDRLVELAQRPWFTYTPVVSQDPHFTGAHGLVGDVAADEQAWTGRLALICGPDTMVRHTAAALRRAGMPEHDIRHEELPTDPHPVTAHGQETS